MWKTFNPMAGFVHIWPKIGLKQPSIFFVSSPQNEHSIIYSSSSCSKPVSISLLCETSKKIFWRMSVTKQLSRASLTSIVFLTFSLWTSMGSFNGYRHSSK